MNYALMTDYMSVGEAASLSGYADEYIRQLLRKGKVKGVHKSRVWWIDKEDFERYWSRMSELGTGRHNPHLNKSE